MAWFESAAVSSGIVVSLHGQVAHFSASGLTGNPPVLSPAISVVSFLAPQSTLKAKAKNLVMKEQGAISTISQKQGYYLSAILQTIL